MWEEGARIYGTPGVPNNFPRISALWSFMAKIASGNEFNGLGSSGEGLN